MEQYPIYTEHPTVLLIDDEESPMRNRSQSLTYYKDAMDSLGVSYYFRNLTLSPINQNFINQFQKVIWFTGISNHNSNILPDDEQIILMQYLDQGGQLLLSSQNAGDYCGNTAFFTDYLKVNHIDDTWSGSTLVKGEENDTISNGLLFFISGGDGNNSSFSPSVIEAVGEGVPILKYSNTSNFCGVRCAEDYKTVFISFGLEAINNFDSRKELLNRTLTWFDDISTGLIENQMSSVFSNNLHIFPNPANEHFIIKLLPNTEGFVKINITDLSGKLLREKRINASVIDMYYWDNFNLQPGMYLVNLYTKNHCYSQKLLLQ